MILAKKTKYENEQKFYYDIQAIINNWWDKLIPNENGNIIFVWIIEIQ